MLQKHKIINELIKKLKTSLKHSRDSYKTTKSHANDSELKAEGKYDTRSIEADYLAGGQARRIKGLKEEINILESFKIVDLKKDQKVSLGALIKIQSHNKVLKNYFISPCGGGTSIEIDGNMILVISIHSPIGKSSLGLFLGDSFEVKTPKENEEYEIIDLL